MTTPMDPAATLLRRLADGDAAAADDLLPLVYAELHQLARRAMDGQRPDHTLQATALVNEAFIKLIHLDRPSWESRRHFLQVAAKAMRAVLVDHARARSTAKRGAGQRPLPLNEGTWVAPDADGAAVIALHEALERLAALDPPLAQLVELRYFTGLSVEETAEVLGISARTVKRHWRAARAWLLRELETVAPEDDRG
ncbi:MAG: ECF-type sigma factor [Planctomycetota bacterium]